MNYFLSSFAVGRCQIAGIGSHTEFGGVNCAQEKPHFGNERSQRRPTLLDLHRRPRAQPHHPRQFRRSSPLRPRPPLTSRALVAKPGEGKKSSVPQSGALGTHPRGAIPLRGGRRAHSLVTLSRSSHETEFPRDACIPKALPWERNKKAAASAGGSRWPPDSDCSVPRLPSGDILRF